MAVGETRYILLPLEVHKQDCKKFKSDLSDASILAPSSVSVMSNASDVIIAPHALAAGSCSLSVTLQYGVAPATVTNVTYAYTFKVTSKGTNKSHISVNGEATPIVFEGDVLYMM
jgi:hypothetical protein